MIFIIVLFVTSSLSHYTLHYYNLTMLDSVRAQMQGLSKTTKQIILKATMFVLLGLALTFISLEAGIAQQSSQEQDLYSTYLDRYGKKYSPDQENYRRFVFYQTYDEIVFNQKQLN